MEAPKWKEKNWGAWVGVILCALVCLGVMNFFFRSSTKTTGDSTLAKLEKKAASALLLQVPPKKKEGVKSEKKKTPAQETKKEKKVPTPPAEKPEQKFLKSLQKQMAALHFDRAHQNLQKAWQEHREWRKIITPTLHQVVKEFYFSSIPWKEEHIYHIRPGETLFKISQKFQISLPLLLALNPELSPQKLRVGERIKVLKGPFQGKVKSGFLSLHLGGKWLCSWKIEAPGLIPGKYTLEKVLAGSGGFQLNLKGKGSSSLQLNTPLSRFLTGVFEKGLAIKIEKAQEFANKVPPKNPTKG